MRPRLQRIAWLLLSFVVGGALLWTVREPAVAAR